MTGFSSDNLSAMVEKVTSGATGALASISMTGYSSDNLTSLTSNITSSTTSALSSISMTGFDPNNIPSSITNSVTTGADKGKLKQPSMLTELTAVTTPTKDNTPSYTFNSSKAGTLSYGGSCSSYNSTAVIGNNAITLNALADGTYSNCTIKVTDDAGNPSDTLSISGFTIFLTTTVISVSSSNADGTYKLADNISITHIEQVVF